MSDIAGIDAASELLSMMCFDGGFVTIDGRELFLWQQGMKLLVDEVVTDARGFLVRGQLMVAPIPEFMQSDTRTGWYFQLGDDVQWELGDKIALPDDPAPDDLTYDPDPDPRVEVVTRLEPQDPRTFVAGVAVRIGDEFTVEDSVPEVATTVEQKPAVSITLRLPDGLVGRLTDAARERIVGRNLLIQRLLERALDDLPPLSL